MSQTSIMLYSEMGLLKLPLVVLLCSVFSLLTFKALCDASELTVKFSETPQAFSHHNSTTFVFEVLVGGSGTCTNCNITCKVRISSSNTLSQFYLAFVLDALLFHFLCHQFICFMVLSFLFFDKLVLNLINVRELVDFRE